MNDKQSLILQALKHIITSYVAWLQPAANISRKMVGKARFASHSWQRQCAITIDSFCGCALPYGAVRVMFIIDA